jgi:hypothetical protein
MRASEFQPSKLVIFDIDDTLVHTQTKVHVVQNGQVVKSLNSHEFTHYKLQPGQQFDFGDFRNAHEFFHNSKPIIPMLDQLKHDIATGNKVVMVTARADFDDKELFLDTFRKYGVNMSKVHVYRAGNMAGKMQTEEKKKIIIRELLNKGNYTKAIMYDDAVPNLKSFVELKKEYPHTKFYAWHVSLEGEASEYHRTNEMKVSELITEKWTQKYKSSINCSHPKGFSQKAHCAGKKKHNESHEVMEMVCEDCGMCKTHGNMSLQEIAKGAKDSNGFTKCWPGKHAEGTKKGKNGGRVRNCVPNESQGVAEGSQEINWVKPNFDFEWHEVEEQSRMKQVPVDVRQYYQKHFPNKDAWLKAVQNGKAVVVPPDHAYEIRNAPFDKASLQKVLAPTGHEGPIGPAKEKRVNDLFDKGQVEMPIILKTSQGLWLIGGKTRLGTANYVKGLPAKVWLIGGKQGVAEGKQTVTEYRDRMYQYLKSIVPTWPDYIVKDWLYANYAKGETYNKEKGWSFANVGKDIPMILKDMGLSVDTRWQLVPNVKFTMDMWEPKTLKRLQARAGGNAKSADPAVHIPARDAERHATQAALAKQQGGVRKEPVILMKTADGYELLEGWHRTIQHFAMYPDGYIGPAYIAVAGTVQENFHDGKNPERKGLAKRVGVNTKASVSSLRNTAKHSSGEKQRMAHWLANMKAGRAKK